MRVNIFKPVFFCIFIFLGLDVFAQAGDSFFISNPEMFKADRKRINWQKVSMTGSFLSGNYTKILHSRTTIRTQPLCIFHRSGTIWDQSEIILIDSTRFFCYYISDIARFSAIGYYKKEGEKYVFHADEKLYEKLRRKIKLKFEKLYFSDKFFMYASIKGDTLSAFHPPIPN